jgi:suppressor of ftsI
LQDILLKVCTMGLSTQILRVLSHDFRRAIVAVTRIALLLSVTFALSASRSGDESRTDGSFTSARTVPSAPLLVARSGKLHVALDVLDKLPEEKPVFSYEGLLGIAPTLEVQPGDTILITLHNKLPHTNYTSNSINLHFHGLDVSPGAPEDDVVTTIAKPGETVHYALHIPKTQQPGLYWYHPHSHGEAYWQITSGMSGAIVVDGLEGHLSALGPMREHLLILRDVQNEPNIYHIPWYARPGTIDAQRRLARRLGNFHYSPADSDDASPGHPCAAEQGMHVTIEGTRGGNIFIAAGERQLFRVLNASGGRVFDLAVDGERIGLVAIDGYPLADFPGTPQVVWTNHIVLPPAGRAEFIVTGQTHDVALRSRCYDSGPVGDRDPALNLAVLRPLDATDSVRGTAGTNVAPVRTSASIGVASPAQRRTVVFSEDDKGYYINNQVFDMKSMKPMFTARAGTLEEWTIENHTQEIHAFHIHQVHFAALGVNGIRPTYPYWQDTAIVPVERRVGNRVIPGRIVILIDFRNPVIKGTFPFHCHMLDHEDGGMMALVRVI